MTVASLEQSINAGERLLLDTTSLIAYLNGGEDVSPLAMHVVDDFVRSGRNPATGIVRQVHHLVTNDADWERKLHAIRARISVCRLASHL